MTANGDGELRRRAREIEWILLDVDGVLTDGGLMYGPLGQVNLRFDVRDGLAVRLAQKAGLEVGALSGRRSRALERRARELGFSELITGSRDKSADFNRFLERHATEPRRVAFVGDDLPDIVVLGRCGLSFAPADAAAEVRAIAHTTLARNGGEGCVREAIEILLKARGVWEDLLAAFSFDE
jgi:3-deoxy-D-manno-octulosonate 8-phosphate phosphatase (KDO 8-P phosphatase)